MANLDFFDNLENIDKSVEFEKNAKIHGQIMEIDFIMNSVFIFCLNHLSDWSKSIVLCAKFTGYFLAVLEFKYI